MPSQRDLDPSQVQRLVIAGWAGRDPDAIERHIRELEDVGVRRPSKTPTFYNVSASLLTTREVIDVLGDDSTGEVECVLYALNGELLVGVGSDHTDRKAERASVAQSKQMCPKPVSAQLWPFADVMHHWDRLILRSYVRMNGCRRAYQEGSAAKILPPDQLVQLYAGGDELPQGTSMFCGTLELSNGLLPAEAFEIELYDPVLGRKLSHCYRVNTLPVEGLE